MLTLTLTQQAESQPDCYRVEVTLEGNGDRLTEDTHFSFKVNTQDQEKIRWYLEDFLEYPQDPAPKIAANIEQLMTEIGVELFEKVFHANNDTRQVWEKLRHHISNTRVEIVTGVRDAAAIPWELIRDPHSDMPLALGASAFVRTTPQAVQLPKISQTVDGKIRILLVIFRPKGDKDVPFRSVATKLIKGLTDSASEVFQIDVLRPPFFARLSTVLRQAKAEGRPYHIVHFDGHGEYDQTPDRPLQKRGYLISENLGEPTMYGHKLGQLLAKTGVSLLVLNACRSAYAEPPAEPGQTLKDDQNSAYGSLAQEVMAVGVAGVVAMRYNVYVFTAAQFVANLYTALAQGQTLGEAVTQGRKQLHAQPMREIAYEPQKLQDWLVPMVYEAAPVALFPKCANTAEQPFKVSQDDVMPARGRLDPQLPKSPDVGFFGRDETLLALDRAFDTQRIVLLHAYAGSGKTSTVAEFGRWYALTGGVAGLVLFTSFERHLPLTRVLDKIGQVFGDWLEARGVHWLALSDNERRDKALEVLGEVPVLWIWDNVEPVAGFPAGTESAWSEPEQQELLDFLREAQQTQAKFLLTSRRDEQGWLGDLPHRITVPPMPMRERVEVAGAVAEKYGHQLTEVEDWRPLLRYSQGNPMTITAVVGQALRNEFRTREEIEDFIFQLRSGEAEIDDDQSEGRSKSLGASLSYGFEHAFSKEERQQLALLYFFQGFVNVGALCLMGLPEVEWCVPTVRGLTFEAGIALLDRAAEVGLLTRVVENCYRIHPVLPWYFKKLFDQYYLPDEGNNPTLASHAYVEAIGELGNYSNNQYDEGNRDLVILLNLEEANLLYARQLARINGWWLALMKTVQGLRTLYEYTGRRLEWARLVEEIVPHFVEPATDGSLPGREEEWALITEYRVELAREGQQWAEAERLHLARIEWAYQQASSALAASPETWNSRQCKAIRTLSSSLHELGQILREQGKPECVAAYEKALALLKPVGDKAGAAVCALNLGHAYTLIPAIRNLQKAEHWYQRSLELRDQRDRLGRSKCLTELGRVAHERFQEAQTTRQPQAELRQHLNEALHCSAQALNLLPHNAVKDLAVAHNQIGNICRSAGDFDRAFLNYRETIRYEEAQGNLYGAANTRFNIALVLAQASRFDEALLYAQVALWNFESFGDRAAVDIQDTQRLIRLIEQPLKARGG